MGMIVSLRVIDVHGTVINPMIALHRVQLLSFCMISHSSEGLCLRIPLLRSEWLCMDPPVRGGGYAVVFSVQIHSKM